MINLPKEHISISQVGMYERCARQYQFRYIRQMKIAPAVALVEGKSHHVALAENNAQKIIHHEDLPAKVIVERFCDAFSDESKEIENWEGETKDSIIERGKGLLNLYTESTAPTIQPVSSEREFHIPLNFDGQTVDVLGYIDLEQETLLSDYKVVGRTKSQNDVDNDLQLAVYGCVSTQKTAENICLVKTKKPKIERVTTEINSWKINWAAYLMAEVVKSISKGVFPPCDPTSWVCSARFCGYWRYCRGKNA